MISRCSFLWRGYPLPCFGRRACAKTLCHSFPLLPAGLLRIHTETCMVIRKVLYTSLSLILIPLPVL